MNSFKLSRLKLTCLVAAACAAAGIVALIMMLFIHFYGKNDNISYQEDAVIVLGAGIKGEKVMKMLAYRLDKAVEYSERNPGAVIIVSGGQGRREDIPEALAMERYLIDKGIAKERIIKEDKSTSTYENLIFSKKILDERFETPYKLAIITNGFHIFRAAGMAERLGLDITHLHAEIDWYYIPYNYLRECAAIAKMWLLRR